MDRLTMFAPVSSLECTDTKNAPATPLECTLTNSLDLKSFRFHSYKKHRGGPLSFTFFLSPSASCARRPFLDPPASERYSGCSRTVHHQFAGFSDAPRIL